MEFEGHHGVSDDERAEAQVIELDVEYELDLREPELDGGGSLPHMLDFFSIRFGARLAA